ncbi:hypothetical protein PO124_24360 [Bacillus licheniformis]|nr:hypothetical protein [Bacillus licheniformis]
MTASAWKRSKRAGNRLGWSLAEAKPYHFEHNGDRYGWVKGVKEDGTLQCLLRAAVSLIMMITS